MPAPNVPVTDAEREAAEKAAALDNLRKMFRITMAANFRKEGESMESCRKRVAADPATASVAAKLKCTVDELLAGFGGDESFHTHEGYIHAQAVKEVDAIVGRIAAQPTGVFEGELARDGKDGAGKQMGNLSAPRQGERVGAVVKGDAASAQQFKQAMQQVRSQGSGTALKAKKDDDEEAEAPAKGKAAGRPSGKARPKGRPGKG